MRWILERSHERGRLLRARAVGENPLNGIELDGGGYRLESAESRLRGDSQYD
jgi:hypothetical protein